MTDGSTAITLTVEGLRRQVGEARILAVLGVARAFMNPASDALAPNLVPKEAIAHAISLTTMIWQLANIAGPVAGGLLYGLAGEVAYGVALALVAIAVPEFLGGGGPSIIAQQATPILLVALGQCVVLQIGSIDLSNAAMALFCTILSALTLGPLGIASPFLCVAVVTLIGALNGALMVFAQIPSFALTLGTLGVLQAATLTVTGSNVVYVMDNMDVVGWLFTLQWLTLPVAFWLALLAALPALALAGLLVIRRNLWAPRSARICAPIPYSRLSIGSPSSVLASTVSRPPSWSE